MNGTFRSLSIPNYRMWAIGALSSNVGTWMQRTAQDWVILTQLAPGNATAVGISMGLQFGPHILLLPVTGLVADRVDRRKLLISTQVIMGLLSLGLGFLVISGHIQLWQLYLFAFITGCVTAFDMPARQTFVGDLVDDAHLSNAVGLNSSSMNGARMIGPALSGILIAWIGVGWVFVINAATFLPVIATLMMLRLDQMRVREHAGRVRGDFVAGFRYVWNRPELLTILVMLFFVGAFAMNFTIFIVSMAVKAFHVSSEKFGILTSIMALGSVMGSLLSARAERPRMGFLALSGLALAFTWGFAALMPDYWMFGLALFLVGGAAQAYNTTGSSAMQLWTEVPMRGRVMAIYLAVFLGSQPIGAPLLGQVIDRFGPRQGLGVASGAAFIGTAVALFYLMKHRGLRLRVKGGLRLHMEPRDHNLPG